MRIKFAYSPLATFYTILIVCLSASFIMNGCRKTDKLVEPPATTNNNNTVEEKFFNSHTSTDPLVNAVNGFLQRTNDTLHFVEKTVSQIGYPRWDKTLSFKKSDTKKAGRGNSIDSVSISYVPFVRENENYVNATMIIETALGDTSFFYKCDWQYQNRVHGQSSVDTTAEHYAIFFMLLDNLTLGHTEFNITDTSLFPTAVAGAGGEKKLGFVNFSTQTSGRNATWVYQSGCIDYYVCGDPNGLYGTTCINGCDYLNCAASQGQLGYCSYESECFGWWEETGGGGGGTGDGSGGNGGATGGGGPGDGTPQECDPGPTEGNRANSNLPPC